jgi:hypothetical protein
MRTPRNDRLTTPVGVDQPLPVGSGSERRCILSGHSAARAGLVRLAIAPDGLVLPDAAAKAPGRGAWVGVSRAELETGLADGGLRRGLMRAFKGANLTIPEDLPDRIEAALVRHLADRLGLELRAGHVLLGSARIAEQARAGRLAALYHASDSSEDGRRKLDQAWRVGCEAEGSGLRGEVLPLDRTALSVAMGRDNVVHFGIVGHGGDVRAAQRVQQAVDRLAHYLGSNGASTMASASHDRGEPCDNPGNRPHSGAPKYDEYVKD